MQFQTGPFSCFFQNIFRKNAILPIDFSGHGTDFAATLLRMDRPDAEIRMQQHGFLFLSDDDRCKLFSDRHRHRTESVWKKP